MASEQPITRVPNLAAVEREIILRAIERYPGRKPEVAQALGISLKTLYNRLNSYGLQTDSQGDDHPQPA